MTPSETTRGRQTSGSRRAPGADPQTQLRCDICNKKTFDSSRAKSRHMSYCRKRNQSHVVLTRRKSCDACVRAKTRCSLEKGGCSRCVEKGVECRYWGNDGGASATADPAVEIGPLESTGRPARTPSRERSGRTEGDDTVLDGINLRVVDDDDLFSDFPTSAYELGLAPLGSASSARAALSTPLGSASPDDAYDNGAFRLARLEGPPPPDRDALPPFPDGGFGEDGAPSSVAVVGSGSGDAFWLAPFEEAADASADDSARLDAVDPALRALAATSWGDDGGVEGRGNTIPHWSPPPQQQHRRRRPSPASRQTGPHPREPVASSTSTSVPAGLPIRSPSIMFTRRSFAHAPHAALSSDMALHMLRSYPFMLLGNGGGGGGLFGSAQDDADARLPPFVHPQQLLGWEGGLSSAGLGMGMGSGSMQVDGHLTPRPSPLRTALDIGRMFLRAKAQNRAFVWRLIRIEQERIWSEHRSFAKWEMLASLQALVLYVLMRVVEGPRDYTDFDTQLLVSVNVVCNTINGRHGHIVSREELDGEVLPWEDWVFLESRRRTISTARIINRLLHAELSIPCPELPDFAFAPLPARRALWRARSASDWALEYVAGGSPGTPAARKWEAQLAGSTAGRETIGPAPAPQLGSARGGGGRVKGMLSNGDLVRLREETGPEAMGWGVAAARTERKLDWDRWYAGADSFGLLVVISANLG